MAPTMTFVPTRQSGPFGAGTERGQSQMMHVDRIADLRAACADARAAGRRVGVVPTMGFLHAGHRSLMREAVAATDFVVVTIFVNPLQFGAGEDLDRYPRDLAGDLEACAAEGVDCVFTPSVAEMYPRRPLTTVHVEGLTSDLCGAARPTHFDGVTTVVAKLFAIVGGERNASDATRIVREVVATEPRVELEYVEARDAHELTPMTTLDGSVLLALAARVGTTRLIDNVAIHIDGSHVCADLGVADLGRADLEVANFGSEGGSPCSAR
jgi:pantothenate synthetase